MQTCNTSSISSSEISQNFDVFCLFRIMTLHAHYLLISQKFRLSWVRKYHLLVCEVKGLVMKANQEAILSWYLDAKVLLNMVKDFMASGKFGERKAKDQPIKFMILLSNNFLILSEIIY